MPNRTVRKRSTSKEPTPLQNFEEDLRHTATLNVAVWQIPHPDKQKKGGEDTYFMSNEGTTMGVFDGVGGWADAGVDPREYSYALATACKQAVDEQLLNEPLAILEYGFEKAKNVIGSCTAVIAQVHGAELNSINLGDSGLRVVRNGEIVLASIEQQHRFNMPYQLGSESNDRPSHGQKYKFTLQDGDIVVLGTDGVFDNLFDNKIANIVKENHTGKAQEIARKIAEQAFLISNDGRVFTPFVENAKKQGVYYEGGKPDDITVLVAKYNEITAKL